MEVVSMDHKGFQEDLERKSCIPRSLQHLGLRPKILSDQWWQLIRNNVHNECNAFESFQNHRLQPWFVDKLSSMKLIPGAEKAGDH